MATAHIMECWLQKLESVMSNNNSSRQVVSLACTLLTLFLQASETTAVEFRYF